MESWCNWIALLPLKHDSGGSNPLGSTKITMLNLQCQLCFSPAAYWDVPLDEELWLACTLHVKQLETYTSESGNTIRFCWKYIGALEALIPQTEPDGFCDGAGI